MNKVGEGVGFERIRRITGYLTNDYKTAFNEGKQQEVEMREKHNRYFEKEELEDDKDTSSSTITNR